MLKDLLEFKKTIFISILRQYEKNIADIVIKYNNRCHRTIKMKLLMLQIINALTLAKKLMVKILNLKLVIMLEYQNIKTFLLKATHQIGLKKFS